MKLYAAICVLLCMIYVETKNFAEDYCWRDFSGVVPIDAFPAGTDKNGKPIYVGQVLFEDKLINGKILSNKKVIYFDWVWKEHSGDKNVKIFCTDQPQKFEWISTSCDNMLSLMHSKILVQGGFEEFPTYIGRVVCDGEKTVGKIICTPNKCLEMFTTKNGYTKQHNQFEVLTYNTKINSTSPCDYDIDTRVSV